MEKLFLVLLLAISFGLCHGQVTKQKEVDIQFKKYKNLDSVQVTNAEGTVTFEISKYLNSKDQPESIILSGDILNESFGRNLIETLGHQKLKVGYKHKIVREPSLDTSKPYNETVFDLYTKGTEYAKYGVNEVINVSFEPNSLGVGLQNKHYIIFLEVGDISRKLDNKGEKFSF